MAHVRSFRIVADAGRALGGRDPRGARTVELLANRLQLALLELADRDPAPPLGGTDDGRVHELEHRALAEGVRDGLRATKRARRGATSNV
jgi:hypothetical protein